MTIIVCRIVITSQRDFYDQLHSGDFLTNRSHSGDYSPFFFQLEKPQN